MTSTKGSRSEGPRRVRFASFELDLDTAELLRDGRRAALPPLPSRLLALLASRPGRIVGREELRRELWGDTFCEWESGLHQAVRRIRVVLGDQASSPGFIETVPRRGYRFIAELADDTASEPGRPARREGRRRRALPAATSAVVLVSVLLLPAARRREATHLAEPQLPPLEMASRTAIDVETRRLYLEGSHLLSRGRLDSAISRLRRAALRSPRWAAPWVTIAEAELARPTDRGVGTARGALEAALTRDPDHPRAWTLMARLRLWQEWDWPGARAALDRAVHADPRLAPAWQLVAALESVSGHHSRAIDAARTAMKLDPLSTALLVDLGWTLYYAGRPLAALQECRRSLELESDNPSARRCAVQSLLVLDRRAEAAALVSPSGGGPDGPSVTAEQRLATYWNDQLAALAVAPGCSSSAAAAIPRFAVGDVRGGLEALDAGVREGRGWDVPFARIDPLLLRWLDGARRVDLDRALGWSHPVEQRSTSSPSGSGGRRG